MIVDDDEAQALGTLIKEEDRRVASLQVDRTPGFIIRAGPVPDRPVVADEPVGHMEFVEQLDGLVATERRDRKTPMALLDRVGLGRLSAPDVFGDGSEHGNARQQAEDPTTGQRVPGAVRFLHVRGVGRHEGAVHRRTGLLCSAIPRSPTSGASVRSASKDSALGGGCSRWIPPKQSAGSASERRPCLGRRVTSNDRITRRACSESAGKQRPS